jgi:hypothetical protein
MPLHANAAGLDLHESKRMKEPVRAASTATVTLASPGATIDGVTLVAGDRVLLKNQASTFENGIHTWSGAAVALVRTADADSAADFTYGFFVFVREGTANAATYWVMTQTAAITLETTSITFVKVDSGTFAGEVTGTDFKPTGLTGATSVSRYVGATASLAPTTGTFAAGDWVIDLVCKTWICTVGGSPGTWIQLNASISGGANGQALNFLALTELTTIAAAATTTTTIQIPAACILLAVSVRVTVVIPTAATFTVIGNTSTTVYNTAAVSTAANTTDAGTAAGAVFNGTAQTVRITPNLTPANNSGRVRVTIFYMTSTPPTS